jgi:hypothetical protein
MRNCDLAKLTFSYRVQRFEPTFRTLKCSPFVHDCLSSMIVSLVLHHVELLMHLSMSADPDAQLNYCIHLKVLHAAQTFSTMLLGHVTRLIFNS